MNNKESICSSIISRLNDKLSGGMVLAISGPWGCGKTYFWNYDILPSLDKNKTITLSLFGLDSIASLKTQLMNHCLLKNAKSLGETGIKRVLNDKKTLLSVGAKLVLNKVDSFIGNSFFSAGLDPIQLVDDNLTICLDDVERISNNVKMEEVLGLTNFLSEHKKCKIIIIMNGDELNNNIDHKKAFGSYKERVIDYYFTVSSDIESSYDIFIKSAPSSLQSFLQENKHVILRSIIISNCENLRTLKRAIEIIKEILSYRENISLRPQIIPSLVALQIEHSLGTLSEERIYTFNEADIIAYQVWSDQENDETKEKQEKLVFYDKYFKDYHDYYFIKAFYDRIKVGYFDWELLQREIAEIEKPEDDEISLLTEPINKRNWHFYSDDEYRKWIKDVEEILISDKIFPTDLLVRLYINLVNASDWINTKINQETVDIIKVRLGKNAESGDLTFDPSDSYNFPSKEIWQPLLEGYFSKAKQGMVNKFIKAILEALNEENLSQYQELLRSDFNAVMACVSSEILLYFEKLILKDRPFFHSTIEYLIRILSEYTTIYNDECNLGKEKVKTMLNVLINSPDIGSSDKRRLRSLINRHFGENK